MPSRRKELFVEQLARLSLPHARAIETASGPAERFEALTLAEQWLRGGMASLRLFAEHVNVHVAGDLRADRIALAEVRSAVLLALADVVGAGTIVSAFELEACEACGGEMEPARARFCLACNEDQVDGVVFPWVAP